METAKISTINAMENGQQCVIRGLILQIDPKTSRTGNKYAAITFTDGTDTSMVNTFIGPADAIIQKGYMGSVADMRILKDQNGYLKIERLRQVPDVDISEYIPAAPIKAETMFVSIVQKMQDCGEIGKIGVELYGRNKEDLLIWSAAKVMHHNILSGLLYHSYRMVDLVSHIADVYPSIDRNILIVGAAIHDIGKLKELYTNQLGVADYTIEGNLFGHSLLGIQMIDEIVSSFGPLYTEENAAEIRHLKHMVASHHGELEYGAISRPATSEAFILHEADMIDSKFYSYEHETASLKPGEISDQIYSLNKVRVFNPNPIEPSIDASDEELTFD